MRVEARLAWTGVRHRPGTWLLLAVGLALAALLPVVAAGLRAESGVAAVRAAVDALPPAQRTLLAITSRDIRDDTLAATDRSVRDGLDGAGIDDLRGLLAFRPLAVGGATFTLIADSDLGADVAVLSGRPPATCTAQRCEVLSVRADGSAPAPPSRYATAASELGLVVTGTAVLTEPRLVGAGLVSSDADLLLGADPGALAGLRSLRLFGRTTGWLGSLDAVDLAGRGVPTFDQQLAAVSADVADAGPLSVSWPAGPIGAAAARAESGGRRFAVLGAGAGVLQLGFCLVVATAHRRRHRATALVLGRRSGSAAQLTLIATAQALPAVLVGLAAGVLAGALVVQRRATLLVGPAPADGAGRSADAVVAAALQSTWTTVLALGAAALVLVVGTLRSSASERTTGLLADALLVGCAGAVMLAVVSSTGTSGDSPLSPSVVVLVAVATGLVAARCWRVLARVATRSRRVDGVRAVTWLGALRRPAIPLLTCGFVAAASCSLVFAGGYRASLEQSALDQAAAAVPLEVRIAPSTRVAVPSSVVDPAALEALGPGVRVEPVITSTVTAFAGAPGALALPLTGLDPDVLPRMHEFAATTGSDADPADLAARLAAAARPGGANPVLPEGVAQISIDARGVSPLVEVSVWVAGPSGDEYAVRLTRAQGRLDAALAHGPALSVRAVEVTETADREMHRQHGVGEGDADRELTSGTFTLGEVRADGVSLPWSWAGWFSDQAELSTTGQGLRVGYRIGDVRTVLTPAPPDEVSLPVLVDPAVAARAGAQQTFGLTVNGRTVTAAIVGVLPRLTSVGPSYVVADRSAVVALLDRTAPGTASVGQVWIEAPDSAMPAVRAALDASPATTATLLYRSDLARDIAGDAVAIRSITLLELSGLLALALGMVAVATAVRGDAEESAADHLALEIGGRPPSTLRRILLGRVGPVAVVGVVVGLVGGWVLTALAVRLLVTGAGGGAVEPPLRVVIEPWTAGLVVVAALVGTAVAAVLAVAGSYRSGLPQPPEAELR